MASTIHVDIVSAEGALYDGVAARVIVPGLMGELGIAPRHAPLITGLKSGEVVLRDEEGNEEYFFVSGGILEVQPFNVTILADTALRADDIDEAAAEAAEAAAKEALSGAESHTDFSRAQGELAEAAARLKVLRSLRKAKG
ncbi:MAG: F0F1 ATP synthase subunit epsilon [Gammaproteobacteria bacterium]